MPLTVKVWNNYDTASFKYSKYLKCIQIAQYYFARIVQKRSNFSNVEFFIEVPYNMIYYFKAFNLIVNRSGKVHLGKHTQNRDTGDVQKQLKAKNSQRISK